MRNIGPACRLSQSESKGRACIQRHQSRVNCWGCDVTAWHFIIVVCLPRENHVKKKEKKRNTTTLGGRIWEDSGGPFHWSVLAGANFQDQDKKESEKSAIPSTSGRQARNSSRWFFFPPFTSCSCQEFFSAFSPMEMFDRRFFPMPSPDFPQKGPRCDT